MTTRRRAIILAGLVYVCLWAYIIWANWDELMNDLVWK